MNEKERRAELLKLHIDVVVGKAIALGLRRPTVDDTKRNIVTAIIEAETKAERDKWPHNISEGGVHFLAANQTCACKNRHVYAVDAVVEEDK